MKTVQLFVNNKFYKTINTIQDNCYYEATFSTASNFQSDSVYAESIAKIVAFEILQLRNQSSTLYVAWVNDPEIVVRDEALWY